MNSYRNKFFIKYSTTGIRFVSVDRTVCSLYVVCILNLFYFREGQLKNLTAAYDSYNKHKGIVSSSLGLKLISIGIT